MSSSRWPTLLLFALCAGASGCGGQPDDGGTPPADEPELRIDTSTYSLMPSEENRYLCFTTRLPEDAATIITEITPIYGKAIHHLGVYYTLSPEPEGAFHCPELVRDTWLPLYGGGAESGTLKLPEGAGFKLGKGQQILVQLHLLNPSTEPVEDKATVVFKTADPSKPVTQAGMFGFDHRGIQIPPHMNDVEQVLSCPDVGVDMDVFAVFGHMHTLGRHIEVSRGAQPGEEVLYKADWVFDEQPTTPAQFKVAPTDDIHIRCRYDNPTDNAIGYGESTYDEMCSFVFYYTPYVGLNGCVANPAP